MEDLFTNRPPNLAQGVVMDQITAGMKAMAAMLTTLLPPSRYRSLAMTKLEETSMWAKKAAAFTVATDVANPPVVVDNLCMACGHREYDHLTEEGTCWKCSCPGYLAEDDDDREPDGGRVRSEDFVSAAASVYRAFSVGLMEGAHEPPPCPGDTDGDGNCPLHSHCATGRLWRPGERMVDLADDEPLAPSRSVVDDRRSER